MKPIPALHVRLEGLTYSSRFPLTISGTQISSPVPSYCNILGIISACAGRIVKPNETRIGFEFHCQSHDLELERIQRWEVKRGRMMPHSKGPGISKRQVYWHPKLDIYVTNLNLKSAFEKPAATPSLGRSQDVAWIELVREVELHPTAKGALGPTLVPLPQRGIPGLPVRLPEWMNNTKVGYVRTAGPFGIYIAMVPTTKDRFEVERHNLYHPSDSQQEGNVIYLHEWMNDGQAFS